MDKNPKIHPPALPWYLVLLQMSPVIAQMALDIILAVRTQNSISSPALTQSQIDTGIPDPLDE